MLFACCVLCCLLVLSVAVLSVVVFCVVVFHHRLRVRYYVRGPKKGEDRHVCPPPRFGFGF
jgi:hypothetical protein